MRERIVERYELTENGEIIIDVSVRNIEDLYDNFDKRAHSFKKDLNQDLVKYLIDSILEIEKEKFIIRFNLESQTQTDSVERLKNSIKNFFIYLQELESKKMKEMILASSVFFIMGLLIASVSVPMNQSDFIKTNMAFAVIAEGLTVAAWVSLWESLATFLIKWMPYKKKIFLYGRIANAKIECNFGKL